MLPAFLPPQARKLAPEGLEPSHIMVKTLCLNLLTMKPPRLSSA